MYSKETKFLVVDDLMGIRTVFKRLLISLGYNNVIEAGNGKEAYEMLEASYNENAPVNVVMIDLRMPEMDGTQFTKQVRGNAKYNNVAILMISAENDKEAIVSAVRAGVTEYLIKPLNENTLIEKLASAKTKTGQLTK